MITNLGRPGQIGCFSTMVASFAMGVEDIVAQLLYAAGGHGDVIL